MEEKKRRNNRALQKVHSPGPKCGGLVLKLLVLLPFLLLLIIIILKIILYLYLLINLRLLMGDDHITSLGLRLFYC